MGKIGYFDADVVTPEEIIMATGMMPIRLLGDPEVALEKANQHVPPTHCVWARNILEQALHGLDPDIKGVITSHGCDCTNREFDIWLEAVDIDFMYYLNVPLKRNKTAQKFFVNDLKELISRLEETFNVEITKEKIRENIKLMNKIRKLLKEISEYRSTLVLKGSEFHALVRMAQTEEKQKVLETLQTKLKELRNKEATKKEAKRILLTGSVMDDTKFLEYLEELGYQVVIDDLCIGTRYFWELVDEEKDPIKALAEYHLTKPIYSTKFPSYTRFENIKQLAQLYDVDGVLNIAQKFCEPMMYDHPYMKKEFKKMGMPYTFIEVLYNRENYKQLSTRFEAFAEIL